MTRLILGNFDFEHELAATTGSYNRSRRQERLNAELAPCLIPLAQSGDQLLTAFPLPEAFLESQFRAGLPEIICQNPANRGEETPSSKRMSVATKPAFCWGWSDAANKTLLRLGVRHELDCDGLNHDEPGEPDHLGDSSTSATARRLMAIRQGNSRRFSCQLEDELETALPGACVLHNVAELTTAVERAAQQWNIPTESLRWVIKADFGMSGRERLTGTGTELSPQSVRWLASRTEHHSVVYFEPWVSSRIEVSTQWELAASEPQQDASFRNQPARTFEAVPHPSKLVGLTRLLSDQRGQYLGNQPLSLAEFERLTESQCSGAADLILSSARHATERLQDLGACGPLGIDAMIYTGPHQQPLVRPLQDINVRHTMGRVACELHRRLNSDGQSLWLFITDPATNEHLSNPKLPPINTLVEQLTASTGVNIRANRTLATSPSEIGEQSLHRRSWLLMSD